MQQPVYPPVYNFNHIDLFHISNFFITFVTYLITTMNTRLKQFLAAENITQAQFADTIEVVRASVSHVLAGRNNPSYDFLKALMTKYPRLNMEWLMFGKGKMYKDTNDTESVVQAQEVLLFSDEHAQDSDICEQPVCTPPPTPSYSETLTAANDTQQTVNKRKVSKIIILFDDGSFQEMKEMDDTLK